MPPFLAHQPAGEPGHVRMTILDGKEAAWLTCPGACGLVGLIDADQLHGRVSVDCPKCPYHETTDWFSRWTNLQAPAA